MSEATRDRAEKICRKRHATALGAELVVHKLSTGDGQLPYIAHERDRQPQDDKIHNGFRIGDDRSHRKYRKND